MTAARPPGDIDSLPGISLEDLLAQAELQTRTDRKYVVTDAELTALLTRVADRAAALQIGDSRTFTYRSTYFDTADLRSFRDHRQGRRRRFKVRARTYLDSGECMLEVKTVSARGDSVKSRCSYPVSDSGRLTGDGRAFVAQALAGEVDPARLLPSVTTTYRRTTLLDRAARSRVTIDAGLQFSLNDKTIVAPRETVIIETKTGGPAGFADRVLVALGARPQSVSKYCVGVALLNEDLAANRWHRLLVRHFSAPARSLTLAR